VDDTKYRRFQFSLRKLTFWIVVVAAYLGILRWAGLVTPLAAGFSLSLVVMAVLRAIRFRTAIVASVLFGVTGACAIGVFRLSKGIPLWMWWRCVVQPEGLGSIAQPHGQFIVGLAFGLVSGLITLLPVTFVAWAVEKTDALMQTKTPKDQ
jgi:hypothetical protein